MRVGQEKLKANRVGQEGVKAKKMSAVSREKAAVNSDGMCDCLPGGLG